ncbi:hypothetical protein NEUTE1DRAFT_128016 [Neurospora tetrasperma FGSC 2508]|uniref:C2H2-type domain-containing protein n=1 Tax=Neurospora tetrasperma (strain FGSC 2508 / ATCC MYA-4615 / P0657) TaxID=510951 RepID=F8MD59_NEUT8|nr:uncharacterized protein NEUTE1DRAFT_128016 [Neurospora tetrasperma FGSC 2508]EGO61404.1 hypothetical protein NEUTE1DRAFT_128016 [Neurospora tetrasperma FGSC 2508]EGZ74569.1 hypothetical protein NEUTE2DRAFT_147987 [Neurospora tetrasperma FGSC 2509]
MSIVYGEERELFQDENYPNIDDHITHDSHHQQHHSQTTHETQQQELEHSLHDPHPQAHDAHHPHDSNNHQELTEQHHGSPGDTDRFTNANDVVVSDLSNDLVEVARATCNAHAAAAAAGAAFGAVQTDPRLNDYLAASAPEPEPQPAPVSTVDVPVSSSLAVQASLPIQLTPPLEQQQQQQQSRVVHPLLPPQLVAQITQPLSPAAPSPPSHTQQEQQSPSTPAPSGRIKPIPKPVRQATKNAEGKFVCMWPGCAEDIKEFGRKCEWNKHMDKHDRPYKCGAVGCEKLPGFTYSGGLLRHEREVHGKHGGPKNPLHCPHESCKRATGKGFSRLENLNEHLRRVHTHSADGTTNGGIGMILPNGGGINANVGAADESDEATSDDTSFGGQAQAQAQPQPPQSHSHQLLLKRKRRHRDFDDNFGVGIGGGETSELREEVKRLRQENEELREQVQKNTQQTTLLVQKLQALTEAMAPRNNHNHNNHNHNNNMGPPPTGQMATTTATASSY